MIGTRFYKPLEEDFILGEYGSKSPNDSPNTFSKYSELAQWCNSNNAMIVDRGDYYEAVPVPEPTNAELAEGIRIKRDSLLSETDYYLMPDYPNDAKNLEELKTYRQALRDITKQSGFPKDVIWPALPRFLCKDPDCLGLAKIGL